MTGFGTLLREAMSDAVRRRLVAAILVVCVLSVMMLESCTGCVGAGELVVNGERRSLEGVAGAVGASTIVVLALWIVTLAGALASDHLRQTLEDGSATLSLSRPVGRIAFALARLGGVLVVAWVAGAALMGAAAFLLSARSGLPPAPAVGAAAVCALACAVVASLAMAASLVLPRLATVLLVFAGVGMTALANGWSLLRGASGGWLGLVDRLGPPLASAVAAPLSAWVPQVDLASGEVGLVARLLVWLVVGLALLALGFRRLEL